MSYNAIVCRVNTRPHPNADRIKLATAHGHQVVVGLDVPDGQLGVFFPTDGQLSEEMCSANDLIGYTDPETGEKKGGFFSANRRVRSQRFRGERSDGYWTPLSSLAFTGYDVNLLKEGDQFSELNGVPICNKYFTPATLRAMKNGQKTSLRRENKCFAKHIDTLKFQYEVDRIPANSVIYITEKLHGTSGRLGYVIDEKPVPKRPWWKKLLMVGTKPEPKKEYTHLIGTRNVILKDADHSGYYGDETFRYRSVENLIGNLHKGEVLYYELVGYTTTGAPIMGSQSTSELKDIREKYGDLMEYSYSQPVGTCGLYVYRITQVNEDGIAVELPWQRVKERCGELGIMHVPEIATPYWYTGNVSELRLMVEALMEGPSTIDDRHIREGVVLRVEGWKDMFLKAKSFSFGVLEGYLKSREDYVDTEEIA